MCSECEELKSIITNKDTHMAVLSKNIANQGVQMQNQSSEISNLATTVAASTGQIAGLTLLIKGPDDKPEDGMWYRQDQDSKALANHLKQHGDREAKFWDLIKPNIADIIKIIVAVLVVLVALGSSNEILTKVLGG